MGKKGVNDRKTFVRSQIPNQGILYKIGITINQRVFWKRNYLTLVDSDGGCIYKSLIFGHYMNCPACDTPRTYIAIGTTDPKVECFCQSNCLNNNYKLLSCLQVVTKQFQSVARIWESCQPSSTFSSTSTSSSTSATTSITLEKASPILHLPEARLESAKNWLVLWQFAHKRKDLKHPNFPMICSCIVILTRKIVKQSIEMECWYPIRKMVQNLMNMECR